MKQKTCKSAKVSSRAYLSQYNESKCCETCGSSNQPSKMLLCDFCDDGYHLECHIPPLESIPEGDWNCWRCIKEILNRPSVAKPSLKHQLCLKCSKSFAKYQSIEVQAQPIKANSIIVCNFCKQAYHSDCFNQYKQAVNCSICAVKIRSSAPQSHQAFIEYVRLAQENVRTALKGTWIALRPLTLSKTQSASKTKLQGLKAPKPASSWSLARKAQVSLYYALITKRMNLCHSQLYRRGTRDMSFNRNLKGDALLPHPQDVVEFMKFQRDVNEGLVWAFQICESREKGFYVVAKEAIEQKTILVEYAGQVVNSRRSLQLGDWNDSIFMLIKHPSSHRSLDIVPYQFGNFSRFICGINNAKDSDKANVEAVKILIDGRVRLIIISSRQIKANETLFLDYNAGPFEQYPTDTFV